MSTSRDPLRIGIVGIGGYAGAIAERLIDAQQSPSGRVQVVAACDPKVEAMPDREEALDGIAGHLKRYWAPRMRQALLAHMNEGSPGLMPLVAEAVRSRGM